MLQVLRQVDDENKMSFKWEDITQTSKQIYTYWLLLLCKMYFEKTFSDQVILAPTRYLF